MSAPLLVVLVLVVALVVAGGVTYNRLVIRRNRVDSTWSDVDVLLRRRHDLVPNLVTAVQGYAGHEAAVLEGVADARAGALAAQGPSARGSAEAALGGAVRSLFAVAEAYPDLKASTSFVELQQQLSATEDGLAHARQFYNDAVYGYNTAVQTLPASLVAGALGFRPRQFFQADAAERTPTGVAR